MTDILKNVTFDDVKKIFGNKDNGIEFLSFIQGLSNKELKLLSANDVYQIILNKWNYEESKGIVRYIAKNSKYNSTNFQKNCQLYENVKNIIDTEYEGNKEWAFDMGNYDKNVTGHIRKSTTFDEGLENHQKDTKRNFIIKSFNIYRAYLYEYFILKYHEDVLPTLGNQSGIDFYYYGKKYDLKNASSVTGKFKKDHGDEWKEEAVTNPGKVAKYLYECQNENRFGSEARIFIVELSQKIPTLNQIERTCNELNFGNPLTIDFKYLINNKEEDFTTESLVAFV
jgi:hypothetical protein